MYPTGTETNSKGYGDLFQCPRCNYEWHDDCPHEHFEKNDIDGEESNIECPKCNTELLIRQNISTDYDLVYFSPEEIESGRKCWEEKRQKIAKHMNEVSEKEWMMSVCPDCKYSPYPRPKCKTCNSVNFFFNKNE